LHCLPLSNPHHELIKGILIITIEYNSSVQDYSLQRESTIHLVQPRPESGSDGGRYNRPSILGEADNDYITMNRTKVQIRWCTDHFKPAVLITKDHDHPLQLIPSLSLSSLLSSSDASASITRSLCSKCHHGRCIWTCVVEGCGYGVCGNRACSTPFPNRLSEPVRFDDPAHPSEGAVYMRLHPQHELKQKRGPAICVECNKVGGDAKPQSLIFRCATCSDAT
jgi:hypothetical protein